MKRRRIIDRLREKFPGVWRYDRRCLSRWKREDGLVIDARSALVYGIDGPRDDVFDTQYYCCDTDERVHL